MKIKACPCCEKTDPLITEHIVYRIICQTCGSHTRKGKMDEITILWNDGRSERDE